MTPASLCPTCGEPVHAADWPHDSFACIRYLRFRGEIAEAARRDANHLIEDLVAALRSIKAILEREGLPDALLQIRLMHVARDALALAGE